jgi:hypothetical protein
VLEWLAFAATLHQLAQGPEFCFSQLALEIQIKLDSFPPKNMRQQVFRIQSRILNHVFLKIFSARLQHLEHLH